MKPLREVHPYHPNAMELIAIDESGHALYRNVYFSVGGGFILDKKEALSETSAADSVALPYDFNKAVKNFSSYARKTK
ncbi:serine dehydratase beta chain [Vibrio sp. M60_M31a]